MTSSCDLWRKGNHEVSIVYRVLPSNNLYRSHWFYITYRLWWAPRVANGLDSIFFVFRFIFGLVDVYLGLGSPEVSTKDDDEYVVGHDKGLRLSARCRQIYIWDWNHPENPPKMMTNMWWGMMKIFTSALGVSRFISGTRFTPGNHQRWLQICGGAWWEVYDEIKRAGWWRRGPPLGLLSARCWQ